MAIFGKVEEGKKKKKENSLANKNVSQCLY